MSKEFSGLALVVVSYGSSTLLEQNLVPVAAALPGCRTVVVDNWTTAGERERVRGLATQNGWTLVGPDDNTGFGTGCNLGAISAIAAGADEILLLNPDATIDADSVRALREALATTPRAVVAPRVLKADGSLWSAGMDVDLQTGNMRPWHRRDEHPDSPTLAWLTGACLLVGVELWSDLGGFDEEYFLYWEDVDFSVRAQRLGAELVLVDNAVAHHDVGGTQAEDSGAGKSETYYYFNIRNRSLFARKHLDAATRRRWEKSARAAAWTIVRRGGRRQFLRPVEPLRAFFRGLRDSNYALED